MPDHPRPSGSRRLTTLGRWARGRWTAASSSRSGRAGPPGRRAPGQRAAHHRWSSCTPGSPTTAAGRRAGPPQPGHGRRGATTGAASAPPSYTARVRTTRWSTCCAVLDGVGHGPVGAGRQLARAAQIALGFALTHPDGSRRWCWWRRPSRGRPQVDESPSTREAAIWETSSGEAAGARRPQPGRDLGSGSTGPCPRGPGGRVAETLALDMNRIALHAESPGYEPEPPDAWSRLPSWLPVLVVVGDLDLDIQERCRWLASPSPAPAPGDGGRGPPPGLRAARRPFVACMRQFLRPPATVRSWPVGAPGGTPGNLQDDAAPAPGRRAAQHRGRRPGGQRRPHPGRALAAAEAAGADLCVVPELAIPGYPPEDLLLKPGFVADNVAALEKVAAATGQCAVVVGFVGAAARRARGCPTRRPSAPAVAWSGSTASASCPTTASSTSSAGSSRAPSRPTLFGVAGAWVGVSICEDVWFPDGPVAEQGRAGADVVVNLNASPYNRGRRAERLAMLRGRVAEAGCAIAYVNQVGGQDELVFDGDSLDRGGRRHAAGDRARSSPSDLVVVDLPVARRTGRAAGHRLLPRLVVDRAAPDARPPLRAAPHRARRWPTTPRCTPPSCSGPATTWARTGSPTRSSASRAASTPRWWPRSPSTRSGPARVHGISMPSRYSSDGSRHDAEALAERLGIDLQGRAHRGGARRLHRHAGPRARARALRPDRREPPVPPARRAAHGACPTPRAGSCSPPATRARWPRATPRSTATPPAGSP